MEFSIWKAQDRDRVALIDHDGVQVTVGQLVDRSNQIARNLRARGVAAGGTAQARRPQPSMHYDGREYAQYNRMVQSTRAALRWL